MTGRFMRCSLTASGSLTVKRAVLIQGQWRKRIQRQKRNPQKIPVKKTVQTTSKWHRKDTPIQKMSDKILRLGLDIFHHYYIMVS